MHNSAARSEAAATALKSELVLRPLALPPAALRRRSSLPPSPFVPILPRRRVNPLSLSLSLFHLPFPSSLPPTPRAHVLPLSPPASFSCVARCSSVESRAVERFLGYYSRFSGLWTDERRLARTRERGRTGEYLFGGIISAGVTGRRSNERSFEITASMRDTSCFIDMSKQFNAKVFKNHAKSSRTKRERSKQTEIGDLLCREREPLRIMRDLN